jgi:cobalt/nickel transport system ATP-binding protein
MTLPESIIPALVPLSVDPQKLAVSCDNASFAYPYTDQLAINQLTLEVKLGEIIAVCGPNGSGKTTLMKLLAGMLSPQEGSITICGKNLDKKGRRDAFRYVGLLFEDPNHQLFCTHVKEDVAYGPRNLGLSEDEVKKRVLLALEQMEAGHLSERAVHTLSFGEMRRVALAGLIAMRPPLLVLDEPTAGLDPASAEHLDSLIRGLNQKYGYTFLIVTHDIAWGARIAERMLIMNSGRILADGATRSVLTKDFILKKSRLRPPELAQLFNTLYQKLEKEDRTLPLNVEEAIQEFQEILDDHKE